MNTDQVLAALDEQISTLSQARTLLSESDNGANHGKSIGSNRVLSAATRKRISEGQRKSWAARKRAVE